MVDPRDIRIVETTPGGARRSMTGPELAEEEYSPQGVSSIGEAGAIDMTGVAEYQVCCQHRQFFAFSYTPFRNICNKTSKKNSK